MLTFYAASGSPFVWKVWLALEHKRIPYQLRMMSFSQGDLRTREYAAINPRHKVPAIVDGDVALYESSAIVEYLEEAYIGPPKILPGDAKQRARSRRIAIEADQYLYPLVRRVLVETAFRREGKPDLAEVESAKSAIRDEVALLRVGATEWLNGELSLADFAVYPQLAMLARVDARFSALNVLDALPDEARAYMARVEALPFFQATYPPHWRD